MAKIQATVLDGGQLAFAMPRGSGKTSLCLIAAIWAIVYAHRRFVVLVGSEESHSTESLESIKIEIETNELLAGDFPEVCYPIIKLEGISNRCTGQLCNGERTRISWTQREIVLSTIKGSPCSGATIRTTGITGRLRGMRTTTPNGEILRPDLVIIDDPQTDESARSYSQTSQREMIVSGAILGLAGPGKKIAGFMPCTVIRGEDLADRILNRERHPEWQGERFKLIYQLPANEKLWDQYKQIRQQSLIERGNISLATEFYRANQQQMDEGAVIAWSARFNPDELSPVQHAMNLKFTDEAAFMAEYQNEPKRDQTVTAVLSADDIMAKCNGLPRLQIPAEAHHLTAYIDVQKYALFYTVVAWGNGFQGWVVDYGEYPEQNGYFKYSEIKHTLATVYPGVSPETAIFNGLNVLATSLLTHVYYKRDGSQCKIDKLLIDSGYSTDTVYKGILTSKYAASMIPARGVGIGAKNRPLSEYRRERGDRFGFHWYIPAVKNSRELRHVRIDTNFWKTFVFNRLGISLVDPGNLSIYGKPTTSHKLFIEHLTSEYPVAMSAYGRTIDEWQLKPNRDNHWFDCLVGCTAAASLLGHSAEAGAESKSTVKAAPAGKVAQRRRHVLVA